MLRTAGLRKEILLTISFLLAAALLLGGMLMLRLTEQNLLQQKIVQLKALSGILAESLANLPDEHMESRQVLSADILTQLPDELLCDAWWIYNQNLQQVASLKSEGIEPGSAARRQQVKQEKSLAYVINFPSLLADFVGADADARFLAPILKQGRFVGLLELNFSLEDIRARLKLARRIVLLYVVLYGMVLISIGYYLLQRNVIKPARNLLQATEQIGQGNLETRLPVGGPAEIAELATAYNQMVEALQASRQEADTHIQALEETNQKLQQARDELIRSEKLASVGQLAAGLAHELGNPLSALIGYLEILKSRAESADSHDIVKRSLAEAERIDFLVRELLNFSRPTESCVEHLDPAQELRSCIELLVNQGMLSTLDLADRLPPTLPQVAFNRNKFQQVFVNLLLNAVQACDEKGRITCSAQSEPGWICLQIADTGCGIPAGNRDKVFDPFYTTKPPGEGTGLGLAICHRLIEEAGGKITLDSKEGEGSRFTVWLKSTD